MSNPNVTQAESQTQVYGAFSDYVPSREYMPIERAVYVLDDMTSGQLIAFEPRYFMALPTAAIDLTAAAATLFWAISTQGFLGWTDDALIALWDIRTALATLNEYVPNAQTYIFSALINEVMPPLYISKSLSVAKAQGRKPRAGYVYVLRSPTGAYKIGYAQKPADRLRTFNVKLPFEVEYEVLLKTDDMRGLESSLHDRYSDKRINGEWFALTANDLAELQEMAGAAHGD